MTMPPVRQWVPSGDAKAQVVIVHGLAEHSGRYEHVGAALAAAGYRTAALDLRGHGEADGWPGKVSGASDWIEDVSAVLAKVAADDSGLPLFVIAHSMGTLVTLATFAERGTERIRGLVLSGTAISPTPGYLATMADPDAPGIPADMLSHDDAMNRAYVDDPLIFNEEIPPETNAAAVEAAATGFTKVSEITLPVLLIHGGEDPIVGPDGAQMTYEAIGSADKTLKIYEGMYHETFNEVDRGRVIGDVVAWLDARV